MIQNISILLLIFASASGARPSSLRGNMASVGRNNPQYFRLRRVRDAGSINVSQTESDLSNENQVKRMVLDDTQSIPVILYPFTLTISPTAQPLQQFQIDEIAETIESLAFARLSRSGDAGLSLVSSVQLSGVSSVTFTPSQKIDEWRTQMSKSVLEFKAGVAQTHYSIFYDTPTPNQLALAVENILKRDLMTSIRTNVNGLEWIQLVNVEMHFPYSTLSPTTSPIPPPTLSPVVPPSSSPTFIQSLDPTSSPTSASRKPTSYPTTQSPTSSKVMSTAAPSIAIKSDDDLTSKPTFENTAFNNNNDNNNNNIDSSPNHDLQDGGNKSDHVQIKAPAIWGSISCAVLIIGFAVMKRKRTGRRVMLSNHEAFQETGFVPDKDSSHGDGDSTLTPDTLDGYTPKCTQDDCETFTSEQNERLDQHDVSLHECREPSSDLDCIPIPISLPSDFYQSPDLQDDQSTELRNDATSLGCDNASQKEILSLQSFPPSTQQQDDQSHAAELHSPFEPTENSHNDCLMQELSIVSNENPTLEDFFSPCSNIFRGDDPGDCDQDDDKSSVHLDPLATSTVFEHFDERKELWDGKEDDNSDVESKFQMASGVESVGRLSSDGSKHEGDDNEFILDDLWDPDDTDSASESPSFGVPLFEPVYENGVGNHSNESNTIE